MEEKKKIKNIFF